MASVINVWQFSNISTKSGTVMTQWFIWSPGIFLSLVFSANALLVEGTCVFCLLQSTSRDLECLLLQYFVSFIKTIVLLVIVWLQKIFSPSPPHGRCFGLHPHPLQNFLFSSIHFLKNCCIFATPLLLGISLGLPWVRCGYMNFLNLPTVARTALHDLFTACLQTLSAVYTCTCTLSTVKILQFVDLSHGHGQLHGLTINYWKLIMVW